jgi:lysine decarboxylase
VDVELHNKTPFYSAVISYINSSVTPFDVPGHKLGAINTELRKFLGRRAFEFDVNAPKGLDNLNHPRGVLKEAQELFADAFGARKAFFLVNGSSVGLLTMILYSVKANDKIILPRNVHKSIINGLILSGAIPVFIKPNIDGELGIAGGINLKSIKDTIKEHPDAKAVLIINPTYFGVTSNLKKIAEHVHEHNMLLLVDEAHGSHFHFSDRLPPSAMQSGADMSVLSIHKTGGSLTQSSALLVKSERIDCDEIQNILNMLQSTSPNSLLLASLDVTRKYLVLHGKRAIGHSIELAKYAVNRLKDIPGIKVVDKKYFKEKKEFGYDSSRLVIKVNELGLSGFEIYNILREEYSIQLELAETYCILAIITIGTKKKHIDTLVNALNDLSYRFYGKFVPYIVPKFQYSFPKMLYRPRLAFHAPYKKIKLDDDAIGEVSAESIMIYPPGIPLIIPGEVITKELVDMLDLYQEQGSTILKQEEGPYIKVIDKDNWKLFQNDESEE